MYAVGGAQAVCDSPWRNDRCTGNSDTVVDPFQLMKRQAQSPDFGSHDLRGMLGGLLHDFRSLFSIFDLPKAGAQCQWERSDKTFCAFLTAVSLISGVGDVGGKDLRKDR